MQRNQLIDIVKGVAILLMIYAHSIELTCGVEAAETRAFFRDRVHDFIYSFHMPLFMLVSGFLFFSSLNKHDPKYIVRSRLRSLLIPILFYGVVSFFMGLDYNGGMGFFEVLNSLRRSVTHGNWFLYAVLVLSFEALFIEWFLSGRLWAYFVSVVILFFAPPIPVVYTSSIAFMWPYFIGGMLINKYQKRISSLVGNRLIITLILLILTFVFLFNYYNESSYVYTTGLCIIRKSSEFGYYVDFNQVYIDVFRFAIGFIGSFMIITLVYSLSLRRWKKCPGSYLKELLSDAGQKSMGLYMLHSFGIRWYENMAIADNGIRYGYALFCSLAIYALAMFLTRLFEQWRITRLLFLGGR